MPALNVNRRENFVCIAPDEYCLVNKSALTPDMNIVFEGVVHAWSTAETAELKELIALFAIDCVRALIHFIYG